MSEWDLSPLEVARRHRGMTQGQLAQRTPYSQGWLSKVEAGQVDLTPERAEVLGIELGVTPSFLTRPLSSQDFGDFVHPRKRATLPQKQLGKAQASVRLAGWAGGALLDHDEAPDWPIGDLRPDGAFGPDDVARSARELLGLPPGPIVNLTATLEQHGVIVCSPPDTPRKLDALSSTGKQRRPVVLVNPKSPGDRIRFSVAHELGHISMHRTPTPHQESDADEFASEFLMPRRDILPELEGLTIERAVELKPRWGVSVAAIVRRARDLSRIGDSAYRELNVQLSRAGWRTHEPVEVEVELGLRIGHLVSERMASGWTRETVLEVTDCSPGLLSDLFFGIDGVGDE